MEKPLPPFSSDAQSLKVGAKYQHYKGNLYQIIAVARHSENLEEYVVYRPLYGEGDAWIRPLKMFLETVTIDDQTFPRFRPIDS